MSPRCDRCGRSLPAGARGSTCADNRLGWSLYCTPPGCADCGEPATLDGSDFSGEPLCEPCLASGMEHGHRHVHDCADDCVVTLPRLDGAGSVTYRCPTPMVDPHCALCEALGEDADHLDCTEDYA